MDTKDDSRILEALSRCLPYKNGTLRKKHSGKIDIIIPCYRKEKYIERCLDSIEKQTRKDLLGEVCVLVMSQTDMLMIETVCKKYSFKINRIYSPRVNASKARMTLIEKASSEWICPLDADDWLAEDFLEMFTDYNQDSMAMFPLMLSPGNDLNNDNIKKYFNRYKYIGMTYGNLTGIYHRSIFSRFPLNEDYAKGGEDIDFLFKIYFSHEYYITRHNRGYFYFEGDVNSLTHHTDEFYQSHLKVLQKHILDFKKELSGSFMQREKIHKFPDDSFDILDEFCGGIPYPSNLIEITFELPIPCNMNCKKCFYNCGNYSEYNEEELYKALKLRLKQCEEIAASDNLQILPRLVGGEITLLSDDFAEKILALFNDYNNLEIISNGYYQKGVFYNTNRKILTHKVDETKEKLNTSRQNETVSVIVDEGKEKDIQWKFKGIDGLSFMARNRYYKPDERRSRNNTYDIPEKRIQVITGKVKSCNGMKDYDVNIEDIKSFKKMKIGCNKPCDNCINTNPVKPLKLIKRSITYTIGGYCNAHCWYCTQGKNHTQKITDEVLLERLEKAIQRVEEITEIEYADIYPCIMGGELSALNYDLQKKIIEIMDRHYKFYLVLTNGYDKYAPILNIPHAAYLQHIIDWKNKKLPIPRKEWWYTIVITKYDTIEDIKKFKELNPDIQVSWNFEADILRDKTFAELEEYTKYLESYCCWDGIHSVKEMHDTCKNFERHDINIFIATNKVSLCCGMPLDLYIDFDDFHSFARPDFECGKYCIAWRWR